ncbi:hypothetical protein CHARACLAT_018394 [Characodon lateralis]|uniref:Uncharacterized protein n=1 Tax=Characodon lateralis TaxID=208331 RepID=A0ABU7EAY1_9TELE|nr:hypothetical protein [Characodon lateralis]
MEPSISHHTGSVNIIVDADGCGQEGSPVVVCFTADLKKPLTEDTLLLFNSFMKMMLRVLHNVLHFMKNPSLHNDLQRTPQNRASLWNFFKSLALMLLPQQMMAEEITLSTTDL